MKKNSTIDKPQNSQDMAQILSDNLKGLFKSNDVEFAYLGGSWAEGTNQWWSDIDVFISVPLYMEMNPQERLYFLVELHKAATKLTNYEETEITVIQTLPLHV